MRALLISLLAFSAAPVLAQETPTQEAPVSTAPGVQSAPAPATSVPSAPPVVGDPQAAVPLVTAPPAPDTAVSADQAVDPLADLIAQSGPQTTDEEEPAAQAPLPPHKPTILPIPAPEPPPGQAPAQAAGAVPGGYMPTAEAYDLRIKGSILAAQGLQGPMDGAWSLTGPDGTALYDLQIVDPAGGYGGLEGAWRDLRRPGTVGSTGLIDFVDRSTGELAARFSPRPGQLATVTLRPRGDGAWVGALNENGVDTAVTARRVAQATLPPGYAPAGRGPVIWPRPVVAAPRIVAEAPARAAPCSTKGKKGKALKAAKAKCAAVARKGGKGKAAAVKGKKGAKGKAVASKGKGSAKGKATAKKSGKRKR
ncbi:hypothetical protein PMI01_04258 [Caulobacter sp. AP07]|uniref:hypothetical protein n=1 Tax=Caulobacter sp. AP07 TaxID=1144304 RepID=UPI000271F7EE|nr:hypothetical protein [Caulobacter sp. AP07]EJL25704.1 hypothetical protein PMI01_04258 [Caulobacter sp. AP07]